MSRFAVSETIPRSMGEVWAFATDWSKAPRWMSGVDGMRVKGDGAVGEGTAVVFVARGAERDSTIVRWEPERCLALRSVQGGVTAIYTYRFAADGKDRTRVELEVVCEFRGAMKLMAPLIGWAIKRSDGGQLRALAGALVEPA